MASPVSHPDELSVATDTRFHAMLPREAMERFRDGLATCRSERGLTTEARDAIVLLCSGARRDGWTPEHLLIAVKEACYTSPEITNLTTTSERDAFLAKIVTACIQEYYRAD